LKSNGKLEEYIAGMTDLTMETFQEFFCFQRKNLLCKARSTCGSLTTMWARYFPDFLVADINLIDLMVTLNYCKENLSLDSLAANWLMKRGECYDVIQSTLVACSEILDEVSWRRNEAWQGEEALPPPAHPFHDVTCSIDAVEYGIAIRTDPEQPDLWYSEEAGKHTIKYEICTHVSSGRIMRISGAIPGSVHDFQLVTASGVLDAIPEGERGFAKKGYNGPPSSKLLVMLKGGNGVRLGVCTVD
jgi:hypothetical protein